MENRNRIYIVLGVLFVVYAGLRVWRLTDSCLWFDEMFSVHAAGHSWGGMLWFVAQDLVHPPLFYALLKLWIGIGGEGLLWLRLFPVLFSILALFPFVFLCSEFKVNAYAIILATAFLAVNGSLIKYSQTLRMYTLLMFLSLMSIWLFGRYFNRGKSWVWLVIVNILLIHTHYFGWLVAGSEVLAILLFQQIKIGRAALMLGIVGASFVPWVIAVLNPDRPRLDIAQNIAWQARPGLKELTTFLFDLAEPFYVQSSSAEPSSIYYISVPFLLLGVIGIGMFLVNKRNADESGAFKLLSVFVIFPLAVAFLISWVMPHSVWGTRHLIVITPIVLILTAIALVSIPERAVRSGLIGLIVAVIASGFYLDVRRGSTSYVWCAWDGVAKEIVDSEAADHTPPTIYAFENLAAYHLWFALRNHQGSTVGLVRGVDVRTNDGSYFLPRGFDEVETIGIEDVSDDEFWLAFRTFRIGEEFPLMENFTRRGYLVCPPKQSRFDLNNVFRMKIVRDASGCLGAN